MKSNLEQAIAILKRPASSMMKNSAPQNISTGRNAPPPIMTRGSAGITDLPRFCAITGKPWVARYVDDQYSQSIRVTEQLHRDLYGGGSERKLFKAPLGCEHCAWCGAFNDEWSGSILCTAGCQRTYCFGTTVKNNFRCPCGESGKLIPSPRTEIGFTPGMKRLGSGQI
jgi:hypothetical protein